MPSPSFTKHISQFSSPEHCVVTARDDEDCNSRSSSREIWAEDYYGAETAEENKDTASAQNQHLHDSTPAYPPASFQFPSPPTHLGVNSRTYRTHKRSLTDLLPAAFSRSPERKGAIKLDIEGEIMANFTGGKEGMSKVADQGRGGLSSWFSGSSAMESDLPSPPSLSSSPTRNTPKIGIKPLGRKNTIGGGMFNFFTARSPTKQQHTVQMPAALNDDEFLTLNVTTALFPGGEPNANDPFSPAAFKNLLMNAEGLLLKLQTAYKLRTISLHELSVEKSAMSEEMAEAETRARSLKSQLEDMAHQVSLKDSAIRELATELAAEKQAHAEEKAARHVAGRRGKHLSLDSTGEDLGICRRTRNRRSEGESSLEGEGESDAESANSVFSRSRSPTLTMSSVSVVDTSSSTPEIMEASVARVVMNPGREVARPAIQRPKSAFQKVYGGMGQSPLEEVRDQSKGNFWDGIWDGIGMGEEGCVNCRGQDASVAWDAVGLMRAENKGLKERVEGLERAVEGALDACHGIV
ncbi:uncharacterized protein L3040_007298 [Drepanopeziza brunnea f. sp. 'multigermtubi']|uniref:Uncharacterized protein n=1 Tax=Marssonina brunnea f. sp. multigermtubi (strain MB_m1) TaxID=1072389 RepID=K1WRJ4_MARBU|nr:uncharacterized protein MBM_00972 [Drepanopeziza brunnea f. sp. 'multigermtubi' MB_m1]EKD20290.1 hypothetical protein MBM_00972 [Drepanopeziza brunnea f. sp. 'multigermtubi' MB_m1]KAJ5038437.1 hypothetical protein L3040_007298 [Drepanopeziza brunnea f. sp. 'multigermtubi']